MLLLAGHDQPNFDKWHANATAATVAKAAGVPVSYLTRLVDGRLPGAKEPLVKEPVAVKPEPIKAEKPVVVPTIPAGPTTTAPSAAAPVAAVPTPAAATQPEAAAPVVPGQTPATAATPAAAAPATTPAGAATPAAPPSVTLITDNQAANKPTEPEQKAVKTTPEAGEVQQPAPTRGQRLAAFWNRLQGGQQQQQPQQQQQEEGEPEQSMATVPRRPRVFLVAGGRRLLAVVRPDQAFVEYAIRTNASEPWAVRDTVKRKLMASTANFGMATGVTPQGFYTMLRENGVSYYPSMWVDGEQILSGKVAMDAPPNRFINGTSKNFQHKLYKHSDLVKDKKMPAKNITTNATVTEPSFVMANRR